MSGAAPNYQSTILRQHLEEIRFRILTMNTVNLERDRDLLAAIRDQARDIGDADLELYALNNYGLTYLVFGELERAYQEFTAGVERATAYANEARWLTFQLNQGVTRLMQRELSAARALLEGFLPRLRAASANPENSARLYLTYAYLAITTADLYDYPAAKSYARALIDRSETPEVMSIQPVRRVEMMSMARDAMTSVHIERQEFSHARGHANLMLGITVRQVYPLHTNAAYLALLRVSAFSASGHDAEADWRRLEQAIDPMIIARAPLLWRLATQGFLREAVLYRDKGLLTWARRCTEKAVEMLTAAGAEAHRQRAAAFLAELLNP